MTESALPARLKLQGRTRGPLGGGWEGDRSKNVKYGHGFNRQPPPLGYPFFAFFHFFFRVFRRSPFLTEKSHIFWQCCRFFVIFPPIFGNFWSILEGPGGIFWCNFGDGITTRIIDTFFTTFSVFLSFQRISKNTAPMQGSL